MKVRGVFTFGHGTLYVECADHSVQAFQWPRCAAFYALARCAEIR